MAASPRPVTPAFQMATAGGPFPGTMGMVIFIVTTPRQRGTVGAVRRGRVFFYTLIQRGPMQC